MIDTPLNDRMSEFMAEVTERLARHEREVVGVKVQGWRDEASRYCHSEIEKLFYLAYRSFKGLQAQFFDTDYRLDVVSIQAPIPPTGRPKLLSFEKIKKDPACLASKFKRAIEESGDMAMEMDFMWPQLTIGPYRADFAMCRAGLGFGEECPDVEFIETVQVSVPVIIECDGHDFHERTKEQARRDRQRDRYIQACGFPVLRFTGSELYRDPMRCAQEVDKFLYSKIAKEQYLSLL